MGSSPTGPTAGQLWRQGALGVLLLAVLLAGMCAGWRTVFAGSPAGQVAFVDGDCYARMTRAREVFQRPGHVVRAHGFENYPAGVRPHTTAPLDYGIAALAWTWHALRPGIGTDVALDHAGAWASPLLGVATLAFLAWWVARERLRGGWATLALVALSPMLAHGFALGRPDHQSLLLLCTAVALAAETVQWRRPSWGWSLAGGAGWGIGLWVSLYEPLVLLAGSLAIGGVLFPGTLWRRERLPGLALGGGVLLLALVVERGWRLAVPGAGADPAFAAWSRQIGELGSVPPWAPILFRWNGLGLAPAPALLAVAWWRGRRAETGARVAGAWLALLSLTWALTCWQLRWGYFLVLVHAMSLPWQCRAVAGWRPSARWLAAALWMVGLTPTVREFATRVDTLVYPGAAGRARVGENAALRLVADFLRREAAREPAPDAGILAPWWLSPPLAYWSGQPAVAGSSHESLPGTVAAARFFLCPAHQPGAALAVLRERRVRWVVVDDPARVLPTAADLLGQPAPPADALGVVLARRPDLAPRELRLAYANPLFKVYAVGPVYGPGP